MQTVLNIQRPSFEQLAFDQSLSQRRILIVDDEPYNILALNIIIQACYDKIQFGHIEQLVDQASNGLEALDMVKQSYLNNVTYSLIFMDCSMPIMDGFESSKCIRKFLSNQGPRPPQPRIVALTGHTEKEYIQKAWTYQMDEVVPKPSKMEVIKEILKESIDIITDD